MKPRLTPSVNGTMRRQARRGLLIYFAIVTPLSALIQTITINADLDGGTKGPVAWVALMAMLMFIPTIASVVARLALYEGFADVSFRFGGHRGRNAILFALVFPVLIGLVAYGIGWTAGVVGFELPPVGGWIALFIIMLIMNFILVSGEEIGWRGYMLTRLIDAGVPRPMLTSGLIWGAWHLPLVLSAGFADGPSPFFSAVMLMVMTPALGYVLAGLRLQTGSVWPAVTLHMAWNTIIQTGLDPAATGAQKTLWVGETGVLTALTLVTASVIYARRQGTIIRTPPQHEQNSVPQVTTQAHRSGH